MALEVLENRNNHIWRKGGVRVLVCPPISEQEPDPEEDGCVGRCVAMGS
jgi:hypothetical protein